MPHELTSDDPDKPTRITSFLNEELRSETPITSLAQIEDWETELEHQFFQRTGKGFEIAIISYSLLRIEGTTPEVAFSETAKLAKEALSTITE